MPNTIINNEGRRLKLFAEREGLSQQDLADLAGHGDQSKISKYYSGVLKVPSELVKILHFKKNLNFNWFYVGTGTMKVKELEKRNLITDITDIQAALGQIMAKLDGQEDKINQMARDFYSAKHGV